MSPSSDHASIRLAVLDLGRSGSIAIPGEWKSVGGAFGRRDVFRVRAG
jgi:hypothetical protein